MRAYRALLLVLVLGGSAVNQSKGSPIHNSVWFKEGRVSSYQYGMSVLSHDGAKTSIVDAAEYHAGATIIVTKTLEYLDSFAG